MLAAGVLVVSPLLLMGSVLLAITLSNQNMSVSDVPVVMRLPVLPSERLFVRVTSAGTEEMTAADYQAIGEAYIARGDEETALVYLGIAARQREDLALWRALADQYQARGEWDLARQAWEGILQADPQDSTAHFQLGVLLAPHDTRRAYDHLAFATDDPLWGEAARTLQATILAVQGDVPAYQSAQIGFVLVAQELWYQAEAAFDIAVTLDPEYAEAWAYLGLARARQGKNAVPAFEQALVLAPDAPLIIYLYGLMWRAVGDLDRSLALLAEAQGLAPDNPAFAAEVGVAHQLLGDLPTAEQWLRQAISLAPGEPAFVNLMAHFWADELYELDESALAELEAEAASRPDDADFQASYAWILFNLGDTAGAEQAINMAYQLAPTHARVLYYRGVIYQNLGQTDLALAMLVQLVDHPAPQGFDVLARRILERLGYQPS